MSLSKLKWKSLLTVKYMRELDRLSDEVLLMIYSFLEVKDLLVMRRVSVRNARVAMDNKLWKWARIFMWGLVRDEGYFTGKTRRETQLMDLEGLSGDDLSWLVFRVTGEADERTSQLKKINCDLFTT